MKKKILLCTFLIMTLILSVSVFAANYSVSDFYFQNADGNKIYTIEEGNLKGGIVVYSDNMLYGSDDKASYDTIKFFVAQYEGDRLRAVSIRERKVYGGNNTYSFDFGPQSGENARVSIIPMYKNLIPWDKAVTISAKSNDNKIKSFELNGVKAEINSRSNVLWLEIPSGTKIEEVISASAQIPAGAEISPQVTKDASFDDGSSFTVTAENGDKREYILKIEKKQVVKSVADMEYTKDGIHVTDEAVLNNEFVTSQYAPAKTSADKSDWNTSNLYKEGQYSSALKYDTEKNNTYFQFATKETADNEKLTFSLGKRFNVDNKEFEKITYSFDFNMLAQYKEWNELKFTLGNNGENPLVQLNIRNFASSVMDNGIMQNGVKDKYQLVYSYGKGSKNGVLIKTLEKDKWYNIKVVVRKSGEKSGSVEIYIDNEAVFVTNQWYGSQAAYDAGAANAVINEGKLSTNPSGSRGWFMFDTTDSLSRYSWAIDNISLSYTDPDFKVDNTIYLLGDSVARRYDTEQNQQGYGYYLADMFRTDAGMSFVNYSQSGISLGELVNEVSDKPNDEYFTINHPWSSVKEKLIRGDYVLISHGINDQSMAGSSNANDLDGTKFKANMKKIIDDCKAAGVTPVFITPIVTMESDSTLKNSYAEWTEHIKDGVSANEGVYLLDLNALMYSYYDADINKIPDPEYKAARITYYRNLNYAGEGGVQAANGGGADWMHLNRTGAEFVASLVRDLIEESELDLKRFLIETE